MDFDVAVIGGGIMGSSAAHYLAKAGRKTVLIEQFPLPNSRGSSGGHSRITRVANYGAPALTAIMANSNREWGQIAEQTGMILFRPALLLNVGPADQPEIADVLHRMASSVKDSGFEPEFPSIEDVNKRFRTNFPPNYKAVIDPSAGVLLADKCLQAYQKLFVKNGGQILDGWPVTAISPGKIIEIKGTDGRRVSAKSLVVCPGSWAGPFLASLGINVPVWVEKIGVFYWKIKDPEIPRFTFIDITSGDSHFYALPDFEYPGYVKLCPHTGPAINPDERDKGDLSIMRRATEEYISKKFPCLEPTPAIVESCMYTMTPDGSFFLDRHPDHSNIVFAGGFSGTGFKIAPACGEALARMSMGLEPNLDFSTFSVKRFSQQRSHL